MKSLKELRGMKMRELIKLSYSKYKVGMTKAELIDTMGEGGDFVCNLGIDEEREHYAERLAHALLIPPEKAEEILSYWTGAEFLQCRVIYNSEPCKLHVTLTLIG